MTFKDHFSSQSRKYALSRPTYPPELFAAIAGKVPSTGTAWDCATGSGQAALGLCKYFDRVIASDASGEQIANAKRMSGIDCRVFPAEKPEIEGGSIDLVTVAQALHWFDFDRFFSEAHRVMRDGALIAVWSYALHKVSPDIDRVVSRYYRDIVGQYWPPERKFVEESYQTIPFTEIEFPEFAIELDYDLPQMWGYLRSWSSTQRYIDDRGRDPLAQIESDLTSAWGNPHEMKTAHWPLVIRVGRKV